MTPRNLFTLIIKVIGLIFIRDIVAQIPELFSIIMIPGYTDAGETSFVLLFALVVLFFYGLVGYYLIFKSRIIIDKLKLDEGFTQDKFDINVSTRSVCGIALIVIGCYFVIEELPNLIKTIFIYTQMKRISFGQTKPELTNTLISLFKIVVGLLLIGERKRITKFIER